MTGRAPDAVRLADLLGVLSFAVDLGLGQPMGHVARSAAIAARCGELVGLDQREQADLVSVARLGWLGCIADSRDAAAWFGDDIAYRAGVYDLDMAPLPFLGYLLQHAGSADGRLTRVAKRAGVLLDAGRSAQESLRAHCQVTAGVAARLGLPESVCSALGQIFARWDGKGLPKGLAGDRIAPVIRLWQVADVAEVHHRRGGVAAAVEVLESRAGSQFDPALVAAFNANAPALLAETEGLDWSFAARVAPDLHHPLAREELDVALGIVGDWVDLKSGWFTGHSRGVADLVAAAAPHLGLDEPTRTLVRRAALVHDLGRTGVSNLIWDKAGALTDSERERVRLHSYYTERMLLGVPALTAIGKIAALAHERLDGSGYHRGLGAAALPAEARLLAAADAFHTKLERRPHRGPLSPADAAEHLRAEARAGRLDRSACDAVLRAAGEPRTGLAGPAGLTDREVEVLALLARGLTNRQIAERLTVSPKTVGNHVEHIYTKAGVSTRAAATMFAMEHSLVEPGF